MAEEKASVDKDSNHYRAPGSAPDAERKTAYKDPKEIEGVEALPDRLNNPPQVYNGITKKDKSRIADQYTLSKEEKNPFMKVLADRFNLDETSHMNSSAKRTDLQSRRARTSAHRTTQSAVKSYGPMRTTGRATTAGRLTKLTNFESYSINEAENPGVATSPATSDNPNLGLLSMPYNNKSVASADLKSILENIALQAAEAFELLDENYKVPEMMSNELNQCSETIGRFFSYINGQQQDNVPNNGASPLPADTPTMPVRREEYELEENLSPKQRKHLDKAPPFNKLTKADFDKLRKEEKEEQLDELNKETLQSYQRKRMAKTGTPSSWFNTKKEPTILKGLQRAATKIAQQSTEDQLLKQERKYNPKAPKSPGHVAKDKSNPYTWGAVKTELVGKRGYKYNDLTKQVYKEEEAKAKIEEAAFSVFHHILKNGK